MNQNQNENQNQNQNENQNQNQNEQQQQHQQLEEDLSLFLPSEGIDVINEPTQRPDEKQTKLRKTKIHSSSFRTPEQEEKFIELLSAAQSSNLEGNTQRAKVLANECLRIHPHVDVFMLLQSIAEGERDLKRAAEFRLLHAFFANDLVLWRELYSTYMQSGELDRAMMCLKKISTLVTDKEEKAQLLVDRVDLLIALGEVRLAEKTLLQMWNSSKHQDFSVLSQVASLLFQRGRFDKLEQIVVSSMNEQKVALLQKKNTQQRNINANNNLNIQENENEKEKEQKFEFDPQGYLTLVNIQAELSIERGRFEEAIRVIQQAAADLELTDPTSQLPPDLSLRLGIAFAMSGQSEATTQLLSVLLKQVQKTKQQDLIDVLYDGAETLLKLGQTKFAQEVYSTLLHDVLKFDQQQEQEFEDELEFEDEETALAAASFKKTAMSAILYGLGRCAQNSGNTGEAFRLFNLLLSKYEPLHTDTRIALADLSSEMEDAERAVELVTPSFADDMMDRVKLHTARCRHCLHAKQYIECVNSALYVLNRFYMKYDDSAESVMTGTNLSKSAAQQYQSTSFLPSLSRSSSVLIPAYTLSTTHNSTSSAAAAAAASTSSLSAVAQSFRATTSARASLVLAKRGSVIGTSYVGSAAGGASGIGGRSGVTNANKTRAGDDLDVQLNAEEKFRVEGIFRLRGKNSFSYLTKKQEKREKEKEKKKEAKKLAKKRRTRNENDEDEGEGEDDDEIEKKEEEGKPLTPPNEAVAKGVDDKNNKKKKKKSVKFFQEEEEEQEQEQEKEEKKVDEDDADDSSLRAIGSSDDDIGGSSSSDDRNSVGDLEALEDFFGDDNNNAEQNKNDSNNNSNLDADGFALPDAPLPSLDEIASKIEDEQFRQLFIQATASGGGSKIIPTTTTTTTTSSSATNKNIILDNEQQQQQQKQQDIKKDNIQVDSATATEQQQQQQPTSITSKKEAEPTKLDEWREIEIAKQSNRDATYEDVKFLIGIEGVISITQFAAEAYSALGQFDDAQEILVKLLSHFRASKNASARKFTQMIETPTKIGSLRCAVRSGTYQDVLKLSCTLLRNPEIVGALREEIWEYVGQFFRDIPTFFEGRSSIGVLARFYESLQHQNQQQQQATSTTSSGSASSSSLNLIDEARSSSCLGHYAFSKGNFEASAVWYHRALVALFQAALLSMNDHSNKAQQMMSSNLSIADVTPETWEVVTSFLLSQENSQSNNNNFTLDDLRLLCLSLGLSYLFMTGNRRLDATLIPTFTSKAFAFLNRYGDLSSATNYVVANSSDNNNATTTRRRKSLKQISTHFEASYNIARAMQSSSLNYLAIPLYRAVCDEADEFLESIGFYQQEEEKTREAERREAGTSTTTRREANLESTIEIATSLRQASGFNMSIIFTRVAEEAVVSSSNNNNQGSNNNNKPLMSLVEDSLIRGGMMCEL